MIALAAITASVWIVVGAWVGWKRAKDTFWLELERYPLTSSVSVKEAERYASIRALLVLYACTMAGLLGAILWFAASIVLMIASAHAEDNARNKSTRSGSGGLLWSIASILAIAAINESTLQSFKGGVDRLVVTGSIIITLIFAFVVAHLWIG